MKGLNAVDTITSDLSQDRGEFILSKNGEAVICWKFPFSTENNQTEIFLSPDLQYSSTKEGNAENQENFSQKNSINRLQIPHFADNDEITREIAHINIIDTITLMHFNADILECFVFSTTGGVL